MFGPIEIGDNIAIGANSVVNKSFAEGNCTIAGVPAKIISQNTSKNYIINRRIKLKKILIKTIYAWGCLWYDKKYLVGENFDRKNFSVGWKWILKYWFPQKVLGYARNVPFPIPRGVIIGNSKNLVFDSDDMRNFHATGCYFQGINAKIYIGKGTKIAPNCGFITTNHDLNDLSKSDIGKDIIIGKNCWIGMNSVILPEVKLGNHTIVGAGSIVTKSFPEGNCIIAGNPAKKIRDI